MIEPIKQWILNRKFVIDSFNREFEIRKQAFIPKLFKDAQKDILDTMADDLDVRAEALAKEKLSSLLTVVDLNKIVTVDKQRGIVYINGERLEESKLQSLKSEAEYFLESDLWALLYETPKELAQRTMFVSGESLVDMQKGKSILYTLSAQRNIIDMFKSFTPKKLT